MGLKNKDAAAADNHEINEAAAGADAAAAAAIDTATQAPADAAPAPAEADPRALIEALPDSDAKTALLAAYDAKVAALNAAQPANPQPEAVAGKVAMVPAADRGITAISIGGEAYAPNEDGHFMIFVHHVETAIEHGFEHVRDLIEGKE